MACPIAILGLGYTTQRLARRLRHRDIPVFAAVRRPERFAEFEALGVQLLGLTPDGFPPNAVLVHSIPPLSEPEQTAIHNLISGVAPRRIVYISSTGVYGSQSIVDANTPPLPDDEKGRVRVGEEHWITRQPEQSVPAPWSSLILRSAAIYGPGRGVHVRLREGKLPRGTGMVSRIHVDDLVALIETGIDSELQGAWPVADDLPASSDEVAAWCAAYMGLNAPEYPPLTFRVSGRRVDGRMIRELLGVKLKYESFQTGIPASLIDEK
jgi:nucleoside-diphosphate-sugar epimerase